MLKRTYRGGNNMDTSNDTTADPFCIEGFECHICKKELFNAYFHCMGCEILSANDYNVCAECFSEVVHADGCCVACVQSASVRSCMLML